MSAAAVAAGNRRFSLLCDRSLPRRFAEGLARAQGTVFRVFLPAPAEAWSSEAGPRGIQERAAALLSAGLREALLPQRQPDRSLIKSVFHCFWFSLRVGCACCFGFSSRRFFSRFSAHLGFHGCTGHRLPSVRVFAAPLLSASVSVSFWFLLLSSKGLLLNSVGFLALSSSC